MALKGPQGLVQTCGIFVFGTGDLSLGSWYRGLIARLLRQLLSLSWGPLPTYTQVCFPCSSLLLGFELACLSVVLMNATFRMPYVLVRRDSELYACVQFEA